MKIKKLLDMSSSYRVTETINVHFGSKQCTALRNHMQIVFEKMSSWTALIMYLGMKTKF